MAPTPSELAGRGPGRRAAPARTRVGAPLREALTDAYDAWLRDRLPPETRRRRAGRGRRARAGASRRRTPTSTSCCCTTGDASAVTELADAIWYPIWDSGVGLDHSVRTPDQAVDVAEDDLKALLGLLDLRHVAGDAGLSADLRARRRSSCGGRRRRKRVDELREISRARAGRWPARGRSCSNPNLKESRGGLRDAQSLRALALAQLVDLPGGGARGQRRAARRPRRAAPR